jgi:hypothetical protein
MKMLFCEKGDESEYSARLVLSESQIKSWFSSEAGQRKKRGQVVATRVIDQALTELGLTEIGGSMVGGGEDTVKEGGGSGGGGGGGFSTGVQQVTGKDMDIGKDMRGGGCDEQSCLIQDLWVVVQEVWEDNKGFEVWETERKDAPDLMGKNFMISKMLARKWIHEDSVLLGSQ